MVSRRPAQGKGRAFPAGNQFLRRKGNRGRGAGRLPGAGRDAGLYRMDVIAHLAIDMLGAALLHAARRKSGRHNLAAIARLGPLAPGRFQEFEKALVVNPRHRLHVQGFWRNDVVHLAFLEFAQNIFHARGALKGRDELAPEISPWAKCRRWSSVNTTFMKSPPDFCSLSEI